MKPILYQSNEKIFNTNGIGVLSDAISCVVTEERNGAFELELTYSIEGMHFTAIQNGCIILAQPNPVDDLQPFRIYRISKPMKGVISVNAEHISYDLSGIPLSPFSAGSVSEAMSKYKSQAAIPCDFEFYTDKTTVGNFNVDVPSSARSCMGGKSGSLLDVYGGEFKYDRFKIKLLSQRGLNNGVSIRYGKNLIDLTQEENIQNAYTGVYPYYKKEDIYVELPEKIITVNGDYDFNRIKSLDITQNFEETPTFEQLRQAATAHIKNNEIGKPIVSLTVSFVALEQTEEFKENPLLERVSLCDTVNVYFEKMNINSTAKVVKTIYDCLQERYKSIELGDAKTNIADTIIAQQKQIKNIPNNSDMQMAIKNATDIITGNKGGFVILHSSIGGLQPDEILIMDSPSVHTAKKVWRWNNGGLGFSANGYNGPYTTAITQDGNFVADFITTGILTANIIRGGILQDLNGNNSINLDTGEAKFNGKFTTDSLLLKENNGQKRAQFWVDNDNTAVFSFFTNSNKEIVRLYSDVGGSGGALFNDLNDEYGVSISNIPKSTNDGASQIMIGLKENGMTIGTNISYSKNDGSRIGLLAANNTFGGTLTVGSDRTLLWNGRKVLLES